MTMLLFESILRSLLMAATVWVGIKLLRVRSVPAQKLAWGLVLLAAFAMPFLMSFHVPNLGVGLVLPIHRVHPAASPAPAREAARVEPAPALKPSFAVAVPLDDVATFQSEAPVSIWSAAELMRLAVLAYLVVSGLLLLRLLFGLVVTLRIWHRAQPASPILEPRASVRISASIQSPVTIGSGIVLPAGYAEWDRAKLRLVLAHERAHVRQGDFYLQLLASLYATLVWFSPLGWWLKHKLADLGEALSDRAALLEAEDHPFYAELLLEFAAMPRRRFLGATAAVGMARSSNIQRRIDRILNERNFRLAFPRGRRHAILAALLLPIALVAATAVVRVKAAEAAPAQISASQNPVTQAVAPMVAPMAAPMVAPMVAPVAAPSPAGDMPAIQTAPKTATPIAEPAPVASQAPKPEVSPAPRANNTTPSADEAPGDGAGQGAGQGMASSTGTSSATQVTNSADSEEHTHVSTSSHSSPGSYSYTYNDGGRNSFAIVNGDRGNITGSGDFGQAFQRARREVKGDFIWVERDGKSYVITDPALIAQSREFFRPEGEIGRRQAALGRLQATLGRQQAEISWMQVEVKMPPLDMSKELAELQSAITALQSSQGQGVSQKSINEVQARLGTIQGRLAQVQAAVALKQSGLRSDLGSRQGTLGEKEAEIGRQEAELGKEEARLAKETMLKMDTLLDKAISDGKAKPVN